ncbi:SpoIIE family protein phosphatase [Streptomyces sp. NA04227]|nr:SpoIIE family protein phosphatase [Streptomyces sp. NA04227]
MPANQLAAAEARAFVRASLAEQTERLAPDGDPAAGRMYDDAALLTSELVTNAVMHAGTDIDVICRLERTHSAANGAPADTKAPAAKAPAGRAARAAARERSSTGAGAHAPELAVVVEVADRHPSRLVRAGGDSHGRSEPGYGLRLVSALAESWGVTYRQDEKRVWFRLEATTTETTPERGPRTGSRRAIDPLVRQPGLPTRKPAAEWADRGGPSFLAETSELLAGQLDEEMVTALATQLLVPRLADWCAIWLVTEAGGGMRLARVWHADERRMGPLRETLGREHPAGIHRSAAPWPWPESAGDRGGGSAVAFPLVAHGSEQGVLVLGRAGRLQMTDPVARMVEDVGRRMAQAVLTARRYTRQTTISRALQRRQLPTSLAHITGVDTALVYEPHGEGQTVGGDFYDVFPLLKDRWCFLLGDVQGKDPEAMSVTGLARHLVRLLAREGKGVESVLGRLNLAMAEESTEALALDGEQVRQRFLSMLYGELEVDPRAGGAHCTVASAGHPLPLHLHTDGSVESVSDPQMLLGIDQGAEFHATSFDLAPGETLLCVTDGVTERRRGNWQLDDDEGLTDVLREGLGLGAKALAEHVRRAAHEFGTEPVQDDLSILVLQAVGAVPAHRT